MFTRVDIQKIDKVSVKDDSFDVFNVYIQAFLELRNPVEIRKHIVGVGNLNTAGL